MWGRASLTLGRIRVTERYLSLLKSSDDTVRRVRAEVDRRGWEWPAPGGLAGGSGQVGEGPTPFCGLVVTQWLCRDLTGFLRKFCETVLPFELGENARFSWS